MSALQITDDGSDPFNSTLAVTYSFIPNAEPNPVDIAFIIVAEPGDLTIVFKYFTLTWF
ncbi:MAG TPA: hypothetical protein VLN45_08025 [Ignavibacteriaceae bacterium]|nr:hypothetical protein [Ignavibacteriaceae bacterium]